MTLWAITSYFNPVGYQRRRENYRVFRERLGVPLVAAEWVAPGAEPELADDDADVLVRVTGGDVMWQKERLLNLAMAALPGACDAVAWIDCDVWFESARWIEDAAAALDRASLVHLLAEAAHLPPAGMNGAPPPGLLVHRSLVANVQAGRELSECFDRFTSRGPGASTVGIAWVARRELMERHGFFDLGIVGGGDTSLACAAFGRPEIAAAKHAHNQRQRDRYLAWAEPFARDVCGRITHIPGRVYHLWHGELQNRQSRSRHEGLARFGFDPDADLAPDADGVWRWASDKPDLHRYVHDFFQARREDG